MHYLNIENFCYLCQGLAAIGKYKWFFAKFDAISLWQL